MSNEFVLNAETREVVGKGSSRRLRRLEDKIPAIIYGGQKQAPENITLTHKDIMKATSNEAFFSHIITLNIGGKTQDVIIKDLQRHPAKPRIQHADFLRVSKNVAITVQVPLHFINEETSVGVKQQGGVITHNITEVEISCLPADLPEYIEVDMADVELDQIVHLSDLKLPTGVSLLHAIEDEDHNHPVAAIHAPKKVMEVEEEEGAAVAPAAPEATAQGGAEESDSE
jgi:large subunit ribosomal protein L25